MQAEEKHLQLFPIIQAQYIGNKWGLKTREQQFPRVLEKKNSLHGFFWANMTEGEQILLYSKSEMSAHDKHQGF